MSGNIPLKGTAGQSTTSIATLTDVHDRGHAEHFSNPFSLESQNFLTHDCWVSLRLEGHIHYLQTQGTEKVEQLTWSPLTKKRIQT